MSFQLGIATWGERAAHPVTGELPDPRERFAQLTELARAAGLAIGLGGGIVVDDRLRTSAPDVYAVGDAVVKTDGLDDSATLVPLANTANRQGKRKRTRSGYGKRKDTKRALVTLAADSKPIEIFGGPVA